MGYLEFTKRFGIVSCVFALTILAGCGGSPEPAEPIEEAPAGDTVEPAESAAVEEASEAEATEEAPAATAMGSGSVTGVVKFEGTPPEARLLDTSFDRKCAEMHGDDPLKSEQVLVGEGGGLKNVVVYIDDAPEGDYAVPTEPAILDQIGCMYRPRILITHVGQTVEIHNSDPLTHNVRTFSRRNRPFNMGQPEETPAREKVFEKVEMEQKVKCDVHPWMTGYIFTFDHPFHAVTDESGAFSIEGLPAGTYYAIAWHEELGEQEFEITVADGEATELNVTFKAEE